MKLEIWDQAKQLVLIPIGLIAVYVLVNFNYWHEIKGDVLFSTALWFAVLTGLEFHYRKYKKPN